MLAKAIAKRYGIDPDQILDRLKEGSFRVKANLEFDDARTFMKYLEDEGALCRIVDDKGDTVAQSPALIVTVRGKPAKGASSMQETAAQEAKLAEAAQVLTPVPPNLAPELPLHTPPPPPDEDYESGLSAAFTSTPTKQDLGALNDDSAIASRSIQLETLDGSSEEEQKSKPNSSVADTSNAAAFLPPDMLEEQQLELNMEPEEGPALPESTSAAAPEPSAEARPSGRISAAQDVATSLEEEDEEDEDKAPAGPKTPPHLAVLMALSGSERLRFAVGIALAVFIGYGVMSFVASSREESRYAPVIEELHAEFAAASTSMAWNALDDARATALETLKMRRRGVVILSLFVWLAVAGIFAFLWLRIIDWERWEEVVSDGPVETPAPSS